MTDAQDRSEQLDDEKLAVTGSPFEELQYPPDRPVGVNQYGTTAAEERIDEPLAERVLREEPEELPDPDGIRLVAPDRGGAPDTEAAAVATTSPATNLSAEEDAVHPTEAPPMGDGDGYLDDAT
ncbi:MAG: hypothetical protein JJE52_12395 [Acidimicrobiia bacterium]|nr:hypothetical protein [Acidimicrobiia bacterium]